MKHTVRPSSLQMLSKSVETEHADVICRTEFNNPGSGIGVSSFLQSSNHHGDAPSSQQWIQGENGGRAVPWREFETTTA